jgi:hypothetical protein
MKAGSRDGDTFKLAFKSKKAKTPSKKRSSTNISRQYREVIRLRQKLSEVEALSASSGADLGNWATAPLVLLPPLRISG